MLLVYLDAATSRASLLTADESDAVVAALRTSLGRRLHLEVVDAERTRVAVQAARDGHVPGGSACGAPLRLDDALDDAHPDAVIASVTLVCDAECTITVRLRGMLPHRARVARIMRLALSRDPARLTSWLGTARRLDARARARPNPHFVPGAPSEPASRRASVTPISGSSSITVTRLDLADVRDGIAPIRIALASAAERCDPRAGERTTPLLSTIAIELDTSGHAAAVTVRSDDDAFVQCMHAALSSLALMCPSPGRTATITAELCALRRGAAP